MPCDSWCMHVDEIKIIHLAGDGDVVIFTEFELKLW